MNKTKRVVVNTAALFIDWETFNRAQDALDPFREVDLSIKEDLFEWRTSAGLCALATWAYRVGRGR